MNGGTPKTFMFMGFSSINHPFGDTPFMDSHLGDQIPVYSDR